LRTALLLAVVLWVAAGSASAGTPLRVFAAASLTDALTEIGTRWHAGGRARPVLVFAGSAMLAKQIESGAPADLFAPADVRWMDRLERKGAIEPGSRVDLLGNTLVLIAPRGREFRVEMRAGFDLAGSFPGRLCTGDPATVPVGMYAREALGALGWWSAVAGRVVGADDVRTALAFVERGECAAGIVYASDAAGRDAVTVVGRFPASSHRPIVYPFALVRGAGSEAQAFLEHLRRSQDAREVFLQRDFVMFDRETGPERR